MSQIAILKDTLRGHISAVYSVAFHPTANLLATGSGDRTVKLWLFSPDGSTARCIKTLQAHRSTVYSVAFHPTANLLATGSGDNTAKLWSFSPDGSRATSVATLRGHSGSVYSVAFHPTANFLATGSGDKTVKLFSFSPDGSTATCVATLEGHSELVYSVAFNPTGTILATSSRDRTAKLWRFSPDGSTVTCVATLEGHSSDVRSVAFHPTANLLATGSTDNTAKLWLFSPDSSTARCVATLEGHSELVDSVAFDPTGTILATGSADKTAKLWRFSPDGSTATCVETLQGHIDAVYSVAFQPIAPFLATGSNDETAKLWELNIQNIQNHIVPPISSSIGSSAVQHRAPIHLMPRRNIERSPSVSASVSVQNRPSVPASANNNSGLYIYMSNGKKVIRIFTGLLNSTTIHANKSCPNFMSLYNKIMAIDLNGSFRFEFEGQPASNSTSGLTRIVFDKILYVYCKIFFKEQGEFILLKQDVDMQKLYLNTLQLIKLAKAAHSQIILKINPIVIEFLSLQNALERISARENFNKLYANFKADINRSGNNVSNYLINNNLKAEINAAHGNLDDLSKDLKAEILYRKTISGFGFTSWEQYHNMVTFIKNFWNKSNENKVTVTKNSKKRHQDLFAFDLKFDVKSFQTRIKIYTASQKNIDLMSIPKELEQQYPALLPLLEYILDSREEADENRRTFTKYVAGTEYYPGDLRIWLSIDVISPRLHRGSPFYGHSCDFRVDLFKAPVNYNGKITTNDININLKANTSHESSIRAAER